MSAKYYDLIASLPHLPHFEQAEWLPITPLRLNRGCSGSRPHTPGNWRGPGRSSCGDGNT